MVVEVKSLEEILRIAGGNPLKWPATVRMSRADHDAIVDFIDARRFSWAERSNSPLLTKIYGFNVEVYDAP